jgi:hypothetical protein
MQVVEFGTALVNSGDLDPIYLMLNAADLESAVLQRWSLAYWMFYHAGVASRIAEAGSGQSFWDAVWQAQDEKWPRGTERRHFKGAQSRNAIAELEGRYRIPEDAVGWVATGLEHNGIAASKVYSTQSFLDVRERAMRWRGFGPWIAFKVADMVDAVLKVQVDFRDALPYLFDDPVKGAVWVAIQRTVRVPTGSTTAQLQAIHDGMPPEHRRQMVEPVVKYLTQQLGGLTAPHAPQRQLRLQEYETILCKYKSHLNGRYEVGKDTKEIIHGLTGWGKLATHLQATLQGVTQ